MTEAPRTERDTLGDVLVPAAALYGPHTARAVANFPISGRPIPAAVVHALGAIKAAAATVNGQAGRLPAALAAAIVQAADEVASGQHDAHFPVDVYQTGSGTSSHMNANEVIARRASALLAAAGTPQKVSATDHVNLGQSSNDVFPSAIQVALANVCDDTLLPAMRALAETLHAIADRTFDVVKIGRTHLMEALPIRMGQEFRGYAQQVERGRERLLAAVAALRELPLGGTAVGTGANSEPGFGAAVCAVLQARTGRPATASSAPFQAQSVLDTVVHTSAALRTFAMSLYKLANDVRWMAGSDLGEVHLPALQPGSSMMPGKVNPVLCEAVLMVCVRVYGNDASVAFANSQGQFELNTMLPLLAEASLDSAHLLGNACRVFAERSLAGLQPAPGLGDRVARNPMLATALTGAIGYAAAAAIAGEAQATGRTVADVARERTSLSAQQLAELLDPLRLCGERGSPGA